MMINMLNLILSSLTNIKDLNSLINTVINNYDKKPPHYRGYVPYSIREIMKELKEVPGIKTAESRDFLNGQEGFNIKDNNDWIITRYSNPAGWLHVFVGYNKQIYYGGYVGKNFLGLWGKGNIKQLQKTLKHIEKVWGENGDQIWKNDEEDDKEDDKAKVNTKLKEEDKKNNNTKKRDPVAVASWITAMLALLISTWQGYVIRQHQRLSVRPTLVYHIEYKRNIDNNSFVGITFSNHGIGPAMIDPFEIKIDGKPVADWGDAIVALGIDNKDDWLITYIIDESGIALKEGRSRPIFGLLINDKNYSKERQKIIEEAISRIEINVIYRSIYQEKFNMKIKG